MEARRSSPGSQKLDTDSYGEPYELSEARSCMHYFSLRRVLHVPHNPAQLDHPII